MSSLKQLKLLLPWDPFREFLTKRHSVWLNFSSFLTLPESLKAVQTGCTHSRAEMNILVTTKALQQPGIAYPQRLSPCWTLSQDQWLRCSQSLHQGGACRWLWQTVEVARGLQEAVPWCLELQDFALDCWVIVFKQGASTCGENVFLVLLSTMELGSL